MITLYALSQECGEGLSESAAETRDAMIMYLGRQELECLPRQKGATALLWGVQLLIWTPGQVLQDPML